MRRAKRVGAAVAAVLALILGSVAWRRQASPPAAPQHSASRSAHAVAAHPDGRAGSVSPASQETVVNDLGDRCRIGRRAQLRQLRAALDPNASAGAAIGHTLLGAMTAPGGRPDPRDAALASLSWPGNVDLAWLAYRACKLRPGCEADDALARLLAADPHNAAAWLEAMGAANEHEDAEAFDGALRNAARSRFYDAQSGVFAVHLKSMLSSMALPDDCLGIVQALFAGLGFRPDTGHFVDAELFRQEIPWAQPHAALAGCRPESAGTSQARRRDCARLFEHMAGSDGLVEQLIASSMLIRLADDPDDPRIRALRARLRELQWLSSLTEEAAQAPDYPSRMWTDGETQALRTHAARQGRWPPPEGWLPENERARALILTGRYEPAH